MSNTPLYSPALATPASVNSGGSRITGSRRPTELQLQDALNKCRAKVQHFRDEFHTTPNWEQNVVLRSSQLDMQVDCIQKMAINFPERLSDTHDIRGILREATANLSKAAGISLVDGRRTPAPPSTAVERHAPHESSAAGTLNLPTSGASAPPALVVTGPPASETLGIAGQPDPNYKAALDSLHKLRKEYEDTSSQIREVIKTYDDHLIAPADYDDLRDQVIKLQTELNSLRSLKDQPQTDHRGYKEVKEQVSNIQAELSTQTARMTVLEGKVSAATLMCKAYENIGKGVTTDNLTLKTQLSSVQDRVNHCEDQILRVTSRPPSQALVQDSPPPSGIQGIQALSQPGQDLNDLTRSHAYRPSTLAQPNLCSMKQVEVDLTSPSTPASSVGSTEYLVPDQLLSRPGRRLKREAKRLASSLRPPVSATIPKSILQDIYKNTVSLVDESRKGVLESLASYEQDTRCNEQLCDAVEDILEQAAVWTQGMRSMHRQLGYHKESLSKKLYTNLAPFSNTSEVNVFEFFRRFELITGEAGSLTEQAELLYNKYLDRTLQLELVQKRDNFKAMRKYLVQKYGVLSVITDNILKGMAAGPIPAPSASYSTLASYFRNLNSVVQRVEDLRRQECISTPDLEVHIYSAEFLAKLLKHIPPIAKNDFMDALIKHDEDICMIQGSEAFRLISQCIAKHFKKYDSLDRAEDHTDKTARPDKPSPKSKSSSARSPIKSKLAAHAATRSSPKTTPKKNQRTNSSGNANRTNPGFPCFFPGHGTHTIGKCRTFFTLTATERLNACHNASSRVCKSCLGTDFGCTPSKCVNYKDLPHVLICTECKDLGKAQGKTPYNVLVCKQSSHARPPTKDVTDALSKFYTGFTPANLKSPVNMSSHINLVATSKVLNAKKPRSLSSKPTASNSTPAIDTNTGNEVYVSDDNIVTETHDDIVYVLQILNLKGHDVLTFYDRGSNQNMICGPLAEDLGLRVVTQEPAAIGVVGGGRIWTEYGAYALRLGPTDTGTYHELTAQGIREVTDTFPRYDLDEINNQVLESEHLQEGTVLPDYVGGTPAKLLIGLKDTQLEPWCVFQLPNGLGVYKSILKDKFGSNYCYGGPNRLFTSINRATGGNVNHFRVYFTQLVNQYKGSPYPMLAHALHPDLEDIGHGLAQYKTDKPVYSYQLGDRGTIHPTPLTSKDFMELGEDVIDETDANEGTTPDICACPQTILSSHKARIPLSKQRDYPDDDDKDLLVNFRCPVCLKCKCATSNTQKMMSLVECMEQEVIEKSVKVDLDKKKVFVNLPFTKPPVEFLQNKHNGKLSNYGQALSVYKTQCRKTEKDKEGMRLVHQDLVAQGFMKRLEDLPQHQQDVITSNGFQHYMPWRTVMKESSSTPIRAVVDPSMSGLNLALAKGTNDLAKINDILIRARCMTHIWTTDIKKLYNQLHLQDESLPYGLFLFDESMHVDKKPQIWVMLVAWYGVTSTANQSGYALTELSELTKHDFPEAYEVLTKNRYVDDVIGGSNSPSEVDSQVTQVQSTLAAGGFQTKYIVRSGEAPDESASTDGSSIKVLGYKWTTQEDVLYPGFSELNFNKRKRGIKEPHSFPVVNPEDVTSVLEETQVTRRMVISKLAEFWDPIGLWEPYKLQLKLDATALNGLPWDAPLDMELQSHWTMRFQEFLQLPNISADRSIIPPDAVNPNKMRLLCISDAAESAGGCAAYGCFLKTDGTYSCRLLTSRSKLMSQSIPRNELEGIRLAAIMAADLKDALGDLIEDVLFFTDSTIAMSWVHNVNKRLRLFCLNRVAETRRLMGLVADLDKGVPLYHIDGTSNIADLLTKPHNLKPADLSRGSQWQNGMSWMTLSLPDMPITRYEDLSLSSAELFNINEECFSDAPASASAHAASTLQPHTTHCDLCISELSPPSRSPLDLCYGLSINSDHCAKCFCQPQNIPISVEHEKRAVPVEPPPSASSFLLASQEKSPFPVDIIGLGWAKGLKVLTLIKQYVWFFIHRHHLKKMIKSSDACKLCLALAATDSNQIEVEKIVALDAKETIFRIESQKISKLPAKAKKDFILKDGIFYKRSRLTEECPVKFQDLDVTVFFDNTEIKSWLPVMMSDSEAFFALIMHIHNKVRVHAGVETTLREAMKTCYPIDNPKRVIQSIRQDCTKCRIIRARTLDLEMASHPQPRSEIAPVFYNAMIDTVFGFKGRPHKKARTRTKIYALIIVCLLTGATSIMAMEGLETQDVILALERHAARHGCPATIYVDQGTQLMSLDKLKFSIRDLNTYLQDAMGMTVIPSTAKAHEERGRVERKVRSLREMLEKVSSRAEVSMTSIEWESLFCKLANELDNLPMAKGSTSNANDLGWEIITANRLKLGRNNSRSLEGPMYLSAKVGPEQMLKRQQDIQAYWYQMMLDRLHHLIPKPSKWSKTDEAKVNDICIFVYNDNPALKCDVWKLARIIDVSKNKRKLTLEFPTFRAKGKLSELNTLVRSPRTVCLLFSSDDANLNSVEYYRNMHQSVSK